MTPLQFHQTYEAEWAELNALLARLHDRRPRSPLSDDVPGARVTALYRRACSHLALARARSYPVDLIDELERVTSDAHQLIYQHREYGVARLWALATTEFPVAVRQHLGYAVVASAMFAVPMIVIGMLVYARPELILSVVSSEVAASFEEMYSPAADSIGRTRDADTDWMMFGYYIRNNIGVAFQCFAGGLFGGLGSLFFLGYNGAIGGAVAGYLTAQQLSLTFYSFVVTHSAFELTAIVLSGAAGLKIGDAWLRPGRRRRRDALTVATRESAVLLYGVTAMLLVAAAVEAFWSSAPWVSPAVKFSAGAVCWVAVLAYLTLQGRRAA